VFLVGAAVLLKSLSADRFQLRWSVSISCTIDADKGGNGRFARPKTIFQALSFVGLSSKA